MRYEGNIFRPPSEANSLIVQVTIGCAHNECTFCSMYKDKAFRIRPIQEVLEDLDEARAYYRRVGKIFLADGDALVLPTPVLQEILEKISTTFPECRRVGIYGSPQDVLRKSEEELRTLRDAGVGIVYIGAESGSDTILKAIKKGATAQELITAVRRLESAGIQASVTFISGLGGTEAWEEHATKTGEMISKMEPSYVGLLTLMVEPGTELFEEIQAGRFHLLSPLEVLYETERMLEAIHLKKKCVFRSNHASNYLSLKGDLPDDKERLLQMIREAKENTGTLKDERFRRL